MIIDNKLAYPSGTATAVLINGFHTAKGDKKAKYVFGYILSYVVSPFISTGFGTRHGNRWMEKLELEMTGIGHVLQTAGSRLHEVLFS